MLDKIRIVLIHPSHPGNIGAAARALKTMCLHELYLVSPKLYPHAEATARASGADDVLSKAVVVSQLDEALSDCHYVFGVSARLRRLPLPVLTPRHCAQYLETALQDKPQAKAALLFGREHSGLSNEEIDRCHQLVNIPSNSEYGSLNLAAAVQVLSYELYQQSRLAQDQVSALGEPISGEMNRNHSPMELADAQAMEGFYQHLYTTLEQIGFLQSDHPRKMMRRLRRLFNRAQLDEVELNILRGILTTVQRKWENHG